MSMLAADMPLLSSVLFCAAGGQSAALVPLEPFGNFLMHEQALLTAPPVQQANESPLPSPALTVLAPLLEMAPAASKEGELPSHHPLAEVASAASKEEEPPSHHLLAEEAQALHSILQTVHTLLHSVPARLTLPGLVSDVALPLPASIPQESVLTQQVQRSITPPRAETCSGYGHEGMSQAADAALLATVGAAEEPVRDGMTSRADKPAVYQTAEVGIEHSWSALHQNGQFHSR
jgi:hypothetical protein